MAAGNATVVAYSEHGAEFIKGEPHGHRPAHKLNPGEGLKRITAVTIGRTRRCKHTFALVMTQGVGADATRHRKFSDPPVTLIAKNIFRKRIVESGTGSRVKHFFRQHDQLQFLI
jgi:hypothetical protein